MKPHDIFPVLLCISLAWLASMTAAFLLMKGLNP